MVIIAPLWQKDPIRYLLNDKFPVQVMVSLFDNSQPETEVKQTTRKEIAEFQESLKKKTKEEITVLVAEARNREIERLRLQEEKIEREAFFNHPSSNADFSYWSRISYWTLEEGVALSLGKNPRIVNSEKLRAHRGISPFIAKYESKHEEVRRAKAMVQLWDITDPFLFTKWAQRVGFEMPAELSSKILVLGPQNLDWKLEFEQEVVAKAKVQISLNEANEKMLEILKENSSFIEKMNAENNKLIQGYQRQIAERNQFIAQQKQEIDVLKTVKPATIKEQKPELGLRERESLLKLILGMAVDGYGYDPKASKSSQIKEISGHLFTCGLSLDEDTVRKYLNEAKALFSDELNRTE